MTSFQPIPGRFLKQWKPFANGGTLIDDLSFSYYFHQHPVNQLLHLISTLVVHVTIIMILSQMYTTSYVPIIALTFYIPYGIIMMVMEYVSGIMWSCWFTLWMIISPHIVNATDSANRTIICIVLFVIFLLLQLVVGHCLVERRMPAFRTFEIFFTTPAFLMIRVSVVLGFMKSVWADIQEKSSQWTTWEQHTFCNGGDEQTKPIII